MGDDSRSCISESCLVSTEARLCAYRVFLFTAEAQCSFYYTPSTPPFRLFCKLGVGVQKNLTFLLMGQIWDLDTHKSCPLHSSTQDNSFSQWLSPSKLKTKMPQVFALLRSVQRAFFSADVEIGNHFFLYAKL